MTYKAPVLLFTYRKSQFLEEIFRAIAHYSPPRLYVTSNQYACEEESAIVNSIRRAIRHWKLPCEIVLLFQEKHLFINDSIHYGLDQVFGNEDAAIVLEDDTVPSSSFFSFCNAMIEQHRNNDEIGSIIGCNLGLQGECDAFESNLAMFYWGWATWADKWNSLRETSIRWGAEGTRLSVVDHELAHFIDQLDERTTWDIQWAIKQVISGRKVILPGKNLVSNKGFVRNGSYIRYCSSRFKDLPYYETDISCTSLDANSRYSNEYIYLSKQLLKEIFSKRGELIKYFPSLNSD